jgi:hypothetical protein
MESVAANVEDQLKKLLIELSKKKNLNLLNYINDGCFNVEKLFESLKEMSIITPATLAEIRELLK